MESEIGDEGRIWWLERIGHVAPETRAQSADNGQQTVKLGQEIAEMQLHRMKCLE